MNANFFKLLVARININFADSLFYVICMWSIYQISGNELLTGLAGALFSIPEIISIFWGPIVDKYDKKKLLLICCLLEIIFMFIMTLVMAKFNNVYILLFSIPFISCVSNLTYPIENSFLLEIVSKDKMIKANSVMEAAYTGMDLILNGLSGFLLSIFSISVIMGQSTVFYIFALLLVLFIVNYKSNTLLDHKDYNQSTKYIDDFKIGMEYIFKNKILILLCPLVLVNLFNAILTVGLPIFVSESGITSFGYGGILTLRGIGYLVGTIFSERIANKYKIGKLLVMAYIIIGGIWIVIASFGSQFLILEIILFIFSNFFNGVINVIYGTYFQIVPPENMVARVYTINMTLVTLAMPAGSILGGILAKMFGGTFTLLIYGVMIFVLAVVMFFLKPIRNLGYLENLNNGK
ncbi:MFS transporter [Anaerocolumna sp. MB42-C2]|uniref:MFS transporter n=1 Tax=Anaerocolumna sp. MB42-C2 TaxID=3070997 RepID=UPI0027E1892D|nr:MFS transporter [Anaerocolumna sp. MB42-C2]WMJ87641.1 MFS transporter [Anaerocolumna sp. MB42-C2]